MRFASESAHAILEQTAAALERALSSILSMVQGNP